MASAFDTRELSISWLLKVWLSTHWFHFIFDFWRRVFNKTTKLFVKFLYNNFADIEIDRHSVCMTTFFFEVVLVLDQI